MSRNRARTRAIRERMAETGEPFTLAARRHDAERAAKTTCDGCGRLDCPGCDPEATNA
jgi:hypothetical protein